MPLKPATQKERLSRNGGSSVLQVLIDHSNLEHSFSTGFDGNSVSIGSNLDYAAIHQFGGTIHREPYTTKVRLRTDAKGNLERQKIDGKATKLAVFAKQNGSKAHKRYRETMHEVLGFDINIPARPYLPFLGGPEDAKLQPQAEASVLSAITRYIDALGEA